MRDANITRAAVGYLSELVHAIKEERRLIVDAPWRRNIIATRVDLCVEESFKFLEHARVMLSDLHKHK